MSTTSRQPSPSNQKAATTTPPPETPGAGRELTPAEERELQAKLDAEDDAELEGFNPAVSANTNSQEIAKEEREKLMRDRGLVKPAENAPLGLKELFHILTLMSKDTPDSHTLFGMMGQRFTVGGMRSLFPGVKKNTRE